ncbi:hypothetical protein [Clavibacter sp. Sh2088]|uniref:hypothetical protein n=1 Tax=Clavibacter sp. Sh2088 TaxID=3397676 RepID=UPI0039DF73FB
MTHATKAAAAAALTLGLVLTASTTAQADSARTPTTTHAQTAAVSAGGDLMAQQRRFGGYGASHGAHRNIQPTPKSPDCPTCG